MKNTRHIRLTAIVAAIAAVMTAVFMLAYAGASGTKGDLNGDGRVNSRDVICIMKYITGWRDGSISAEDADFTGDGKVNSRDAIAFMRFVVSGDQTTETTKNPYELPFVPLS